ncbi:hypothetical protein RRG08_056340 [Elysia crispata]|uniref:Uncharacterized protein n=1 Tax=Elysia crispata TaxID=231223 RepID=A0AAE0YPW0_9GAST|nr:hypothetical protein RRG08_056340 [Elysia crispata]
MPTSLFPLKGMSINDSKHKVSLFSENPKVPSKSEQLSDFFKEQNDHGSDRTLRLSGSTILPEKRSQSSRFELFFKIMETQQAPSRVALRRHGQLPDHRAVSGDVWPLSVENNNTHGQHSSLQEFFGMLWLNQGHFVNALLVSCNESSRAHDLVNLDFVLGKWNPGREISGKCRENVNRSADLHVTGTSTWPRCDDVNKQTLGHTALGPSNSSRQR